MDVILAPDVYVNASVALGTPPDKVVQRVLGEHRGKSRTTPWILDRVAAMLSSVPSFKKERVGQQLALIRQFVAVLPATGEHGPDAWEEAMVSAAKAADARRVVTDHPDLLAKETASGIDFISSEAWLLEQAMPPPPPPKKQ